MTRQELMQRWQSEFNRNSKMSSLFERMTLDLIGADAPSTFEAVAALRTFAQIYLENKDRNEFNRQLERQFEIPILSSPPLDIKSLQTRLDDLKSQLHAFQEQTKLSNHAKEHQREQLTQMEVRRESLKSEIHKLSSRGSVT